MTLRDLRSVLFVPVLSTHLFAKAAQRGADALVLDLEDAIPPDRKQAARDKVAEAVGCLADRAPVLVRVNADPGLLRADIAALPVSRLAGVMLPKVESAAQVQAVAGWLHESGRGGAAPPIIALIETPLGVLRLESIATAHGSVAALGFGAEDYATEMSIAPTPESLDWAAHAVANCAHAFGLACWGLPGSVAEIHDMASYAALVARARAIGFTGTVCIHPAQVPHANRGFSPSAAELEWARAVVAAAEDADVRGLGAVALDGRMIDRPVIERARSLLSRG
ncbi:HpcH/HpaI aldolase/citrate lyase family protein [Parapusillimonas granuli]|uniref:CoA ester lyase n=1 Tax=Parapusillimonas granuli TaxID=380911 RepID=A0A853G0A5_9BURK|nr:CoA ester lyase [Parapusillimonas granuli]MBB5215576.1 citrate lyase subunit beta/citryl-CoA lyase [Parapusillimonas granuli]NYT49757.1 CoA ester lyase [Parapusillimonas granuli]